jgi:hypothetical protein
MNPLFDIAVVALIFDADPSSPDWSIPSGAFEQSMSGSILIVRKDGIKFYGKTCMVVLGFFAVSPFQIATQWNDTTDN